MLVEFLRRSGSTTEKVGNVISVELPSTIYSGQKTVSTAGTDEALGSSQSLTSGVMIKALSSNTGSVYVGPTGVDNSSGFELEAGEQIFLEIDDIASVFLDVDTNGEGVSWIAS